MAGIYDNRQVYIDSMRECVERRAEMYHDGQPWLTYLGEGIAHFEGADVDQLTKYIRLRYGTPGGKDGDGDGDGDGGEGHVALNMFVKLNLVDAGLVEPFRSPE